MMVLDEAADGEAVTAEGQGVDGAAHAVEGQAREGGHAAREGARGAARGDRAAAPEIVAVAVPELTEVTTLPPESSTLTTGCGARAAPLFSVCQGSVVMTSWVAAPVAIGDVRRGR